MQKFAVEKQARFGLDGEEFVVLDFQGGQVRLRGPQGETRSYTLNEFAALDPEPLDQQVDRLASLQASLLDLLPSEDVEHATWLAEHVNEVFTGYRDRSHERLADVTPRRRYDPETTTLKERLARKTSELKRAGYRCSRSSLYRWRHLYETSGLWGLVDGRKCRVTNRLRGADSRIVEAMLAVIDENFLKSDKSKDEHLRLVKNRLTAEHGEGAVELPSDSTLLRWLNELGRAKGAFKSAKQRKGRHAAGPPPYESLNPTRPGQYVLFDITPWDVFAVDPITFETVRYAMLVAMDAYTRRVGAWRFTPRGTKSVDVTMLFHDLLRPAFPGEPRHADAAYLGVPNAVCGPLEMPPQPPLGPARLIVPGTAIVDGGKVFLSLAFQEVCTKLDCSILWAHPRTPTDKAYIERFFGTVAEMLLEKLPGYVGQDVRARGAAPEAEDLYFLFELEAVFRRWLEEVYHVIHPRKLRLPELPHMRMSPNDMYDHGIEVCGRIELPASPTLYFDLLPRVWRVIGREGVEIDGLTYEDEDVFREVRGRTSPFNGRHRGKWPVHVDSRDLTKVFFQDPERLTWHAIACKEALGLDRPFSDLHLRSAKRRLRERGGNSSNRNELKEVLNDILLEAEEVHRGNRRALRLSSTERMRAAQVARDQPHVEPLEEDPDDDRYVPADFAGPAVEPMPLLSDDEHLLLGLPGGKAR